jgi:hypothetical protein
MAYARKIRPPVLGEGALTFPGHELTVQYSLASPASELRRGTARVRGGFQAEPEAAAAAFRHGEAILQLEDGSRYRLTMIGHTPGGDTTYFEMRV